MGHTRREQTPRERERPEETSRPRASRRAPAGLDVETIRAFLDPVHVELADRLRDWCGRELGPLAAPESDDAARAQARELVTLLGRDGWLQEIGELDSRTLALIRELLAAASPLADAVFALQALGVTPLLLAGGGALRRRWVEPALRGEAMAAFAMTELDAGSDVAAVATRARREGDGYVISGAKAFISNAGIADFYVVFASTDPDAGRDGLSCFVVPAEAPGLRFVRAQVLSAPHPLGEIALEECRVPVDHRLGAEGEGFRLGMTTLDRLRPTVGAAACGMAARALEEALAHARERHQFGRRLGDFQLVQEKVARMATELAAARLLVYRAAATLYQAAVPVTLHAAMAKAYATEAAQRIIDDAVQILGGRGVLAEHPVDRLYRAVRALRIYEGTTEIQHLIIARELLRQESAPP